MTLSNNTPAAADIMPPKENYSRMEILTCTLLHRWRWKKIYLHRGGAFEYACPCCGRIKIF